MWAVVEWPGERRSGAMAAAAEKLKLGIYCWAGFLFGKDTFWQFFYYFWDDFLVLTQFFRQLLGKLCEFLYYFLEDCLESFRIKSALILIFVVFLTQLSNIFANLYQAFLFPMWIWLFCISSHETPQEYKYVFSEPASCLSRSFLASHFNSLTEAQSYVNCIRSLSSTIHRVR